MQTNFIVIILMILFYIVSNLILILTIRNILQRKKEVFLNKVTEQLTTENEKEPEQLTYDKKLDYNKKLLDFIDNLVTIEIINATRFDLMLDNNKPNKIDADKTIESVATSVFNALKPDIFIGRDTLLQEDYLMKYIQKKTFIVYISYIKENVSSQL